MKHRIAYYVAPADEWKYADRLESIANETRTLYLDSDGSAGDVFRSGALRSGKPGASRPDRYTYDPTDTRPATLEADEIRSYLTDQRYLLSTFGNGVIYTSEPFTAPVEITGHVRFSAWLALDVPDTDFRVSLYEVMADGTSVLLAEDVKRARYRESPEKETLVTPGAVLRYDFDQFPFFSRRVAAGSRLRLFLRCPNSIYVERNWNGGGVVADESRRDARTAHVTVYHDATRPSALTIPVVD